MGLVQIFILMACIFAGFSSIGGLQRVNVEIDQINQKSLASIKAIGVIDEQLRAFRSTESDEIGATSPEALTSLEAMIEPIEESVTAAIKVYEPLVSSKQEKALFRQLQAEWSRYSETHGKTFKGAMSSGNKSDINTADSQLLQQQQAMSGTLASLRTINTAHAVSYAKDAVKIYDQTRTQVQLASLFLFAILIASALAVHYNILRPLKKINRLIKDLADGNTDITVPYGNRRDEIGEISRSLEVFRAAALENMTLQRAAEQQRQKADAERLVIQERAERTAQERLRQATSELATALRRMATGDLSFQIETVFSPEFEPLRQDFNHSLVELANTFASISETVEIMNHSTKEMVMGAENLATRTEQQAASLEEAAAAVADISQKVLQAAQDAHDARTVSHNARSSVTTSAHITHEIEDAMLRIETNAGQIVRVIDVIDNIAFQTNVLALNASVEAARAGEVGRGFAVVASEVRSLAQKSSEAAKDIRSLVIKSNTDIKAGSGKVRDGSDTMRLTADFIQNMGTNFDTIAQESQNQSLRLSEINSVVGSLDRTTQQNAAAAQQFNAASHVLAEEGLRLNQLIKRFHLPEDMNERGQGEYDASQQFRRAMLPA
jgi:methyl-accepting chemotaxis protein